MTWARFDDGAPDHPKVARLSDAAHRLWFNAICYGTRMSTDGKVPKAMVQRLYPKRTGALVQELLAAELWQDAGDDYAIHDFLVYQPSRDDVMAQREARAKAGAKGAANRWGKQTPWQNDGTRGNAPDPTRSRPRDPSPAAAAVTSAARRRARGEAAAAGEVPDERLKRCIRAYDGLTGQLSATPAIAAKIDEWLDGPNPDERVEWFEAACQEAALHDAKSLKYVLTILERWERDGFQAGRKEQPNGRAGERPNEFVSGLNARVGKEFDFGPVPDLAAGGDEGTVADVRPPADPTVGEEPAS